jgi:hypothetical protein
LARSFRDATALPSLPAPQFPGAHVTGRSPLTPKRESQLSQQSARRLVTQSERADPEQMTTAGPKHLTKLRVHQV